MASSPSLPATTVKLNGSRQAEATSRALSTRYESAAISEGEALKRLNGNRQRAGVIRDSGSAMGRSGTSEIVIPARLAAGNYAANDVCRSRVDPRRLIGVRTTEEEA